GAPAGAGGTDEVEDVAQPAGEGTGVEPSEAPRAARGRERARAPVVLAALLRIAEHVVGLLHALEALLGLVVAGVAVRVVLARQLPVRLLDLVLGRVLRDPQRLVVVGAGRHLAVAPTPPPRRARDAARCRSSGSPAGRPRRSCPARRPRRPGGPSPRARWGRSARPGASRPRSPRARAPRAARR